MQKTMVMPDNCVVCEKRIRFGKTAVKCKECRGVCHVECKEKLPLPCIPLLNTPNGRNGLVRNLLVSIKKVMAIRVRRTESNTCRKHL